MRPSVDAVLEGYNATVFAYGQTGTGKTFTMQGSSNLKEIEALGVGPRAVNQLFESLRSKMDSND